MAQKREVRRVSSSEKLIEREEGEGKGALPIAQNFLLKIASASRANSA